MSSSYDAIVIGVGSMGSAACYYLSKRGYKVLGLEQFNIGHEFGSHAGQSRIIRKAYFENSAYVPLLHRAYENWHALEEETATQLYFRTGLVYFGDPHHPLMEGVKESASLYNVTLERISEGNLPFGTFELPKQFETLWEPDAGFVTPERAIQLYVQQALSNGARIYTDEKVREWKKDGTGMTVITDKQKYHSKKLIITVGAWAKKMMPSLSNKLKITRQFVAWIRPRQWDKFTFGNFPCWMIADDKKPGCYYGFPIVPGDFGGPPGLKLAHHYPARETDPDNVDRYIHKDDEADLKYVLDKYLPGVFESFASYKICLYANSPDEDFIIDHLPDFDKNVAVACGFSGHGFKFSSVVGEILADLAIEGTTKLPIDFLSVKRLSV